MSSNDLLFQEWQAANRQAHARETALARACLAALEGHGPWPEPEERAEVQRLRAVADDLFQVAMAQIEKRTRRLAPDGPQAPKETGGLPSGE